MIKHIRAGGALLALLLTGTALPAAAEPAAVAGAPVARPALWQIVGPGSTIYLFGTIHLLPADIHWFGGRVAAAFAGSDTLVTEIIDPSPETMRPIIAAKAMLPAGQSLRGQLSLPERQGLEAALLADHLAMPAFDRFQPWYAAVALATVPMMQMGYDPANGVDAALGRRAQALGESHEALETAEYQLSLFADLPAPVQKTYLLEMIRQLPRLKTELAQAVSAWEFGQADQLARLMNEGEDDPRLMQVLLIDRNRNWANWIKGRLARPAKLHETLFIAVGAGHLAGPGSVQEQLQALGIANRRLQ